MKTGTKYARLTAFLLLGLVAVAGGGLLLAGCDRQAGSAAGTQKQLYTCGMHPQVIQDHPGNCPICGMKLTPVRKGAANAAAPAPSAGEPKDGEAANRALPRKIKYYKSSMNPGETSPTPGKDTMGMEMVPVYEEQSGDADSSTIAVDPVTTQNMNIRTATVTRGPLRRVIRTVGAIDYSEAALADVTTKFKGWVEKLQVDATGQQVHRGDPLFEIYSPELYSAQKEYLLASESGTNTPGSAALRASALTKLKFFDISDEQIAALQQTREPSKTLRVVAPQDGFVIEKAVVEGQMVEPGMKLYRLADLALVWVQAQIYEQDLPYVHLGQEATVSLSYLPDREFRGRVTYIYPSVDEKTRTARVRMEFHNPGYFLKPGMFATVEAVSELEASVLLVPDMAILRSGEKNTVFVALDAGKFQPRAVTLGPQAENDQYQVLSGLREGERIVTSGQFMLDSESQLREAIQKMTEPGSEKSAPVLPETNPPPGHLPGPVVTTTSGTNAAPGVKYICPMPEHVSIEYDRPGKCSICGMTLVPVSQAALARLQPGGKVLYFTCPMPEHSDVHSSKAGKCPKCGMTLIPVMEAPPVPASQPGTLGASAPGGAEASAGSRATNTPGSAVPGSTLYTCPMPADADVVSDKAGKCPKCEMDLVPTSTVKHGKIAEENWRRRAH